jgi:hypothetical protein
MSYFDHINEGWTKRAVPTMSGEHAAPVSRRIHSKRYLNATPGYTNDASVVGVALQTDDSSDASALQTG